MQESMSVLVSLARPPPPLLGLDSKIDTSSFLLETYPAQKLAVTSQGVEDTAHVCPIQPSMSSSSVPLGGLDSVIDHATSNNKTFLV
jgi:hypothetical protein